MEEADENREYVPGADPEDNRESSGGREGIGMPADVEEKFKSRGWLEFDSKLDVMVEFDFIDARCSNMVLRSAYMRRCRTRYDQYATAETTYGRKTGTVTLRKLLYSIRNIFYIDKNTYS